MSELLDVLKSIERGDFTVAMDESGAGVDAEIATTINSIAHRLEVLSFELTRVSREIGTYGTFGGQAEVYGLQGSWKELASNFNAMASQLTEQIRDLASVSREIVDGKPPRQVSVPARGETRALKESLNALFVGSATPPGSGFETGPAPGVAGATPG